MPHRRVLHRRSDARSEGRALLHPAHHQRHAGESRDGPIKTFTLRGVWKDSPPYLHDGRLLTLDDVVEFFNLVLETKLSPAEKNDLRAFLQVL